MGQARIENNLFIDLFMCGQIMVYNSVISINNIEDCTQNKTFTIMLDLGYGLLTRADSNLVHSTLQE